MLSQQFRDSVLETIAETAVHSVTRGLPHYLPSPWLPCNREPPRQNGLKCLPDYDLVRAQRVLTLKPPTDGERTRSVQASRQPSRNEEWALSY